MQLWILKRNVLHTNFNGVDEEVPEKIQLKKKKFRGIMLSKAKNLIPWVTYSVC